MIKPVQNRHFFNGARVILKNKTAKFSEKKVPKLVCALICTIVR